jgi:hypothetical protein
MESAECPLCGKTVQVRRVPNGDQGDVEFNRHGVFGREACMASNQIYNLVDLRNERKG